MSLSAPPWPSIESSGMDFWEAVYCEAFQREQEGRKVPFQKEVRLPILFRGRPLDTVYRADFVCFDSVLVEVKALRGLHRRLRTRR